MCGLVGMAGGPFTLEDRRMFSLMLGFDALRGEDGTGVYARQLKGVGVNKQVEDWVLKSEGPPLWLESIDGFDERFERGGYFPVPKGLDYTLLMGHNRHATVGKNSDETAHPFTCGDITGVHNGTIRGGLKYIKDFECDSQALFAELSECTSDEEIAQFYKRIDGAMALVWFDRRDNTLRFLRNTERPLYFLRPGFMEKDKETDKYERWYKSEGSIAWASEPWMATAAYNRSVKFKRQIDTWGEFLMSITLEPHHMYTFEIFTEHKDRLKEHTRKVVQLDDTELEPFKRPAHTYAGYERYWRNFGVDGWGDDDDGDAARTYEQNKKKVDEKQNGAYKFENKTCRGFRNVIINKNTFEGIIKTGCQGCKTTDVTWLERDSVTFTSYNNFLCFKCAKDVEDSRRKENADDDKHRILH